MKYRLVITTDGRPGVLERTLNAFDARVRPKPTEGVIVDDSGDDGYRLYLQSILNDRGWSGAFHTSRQGFCATVSDAWDLASDTDLPWIVWLEDDFEFVRTVDLTDLGYVLSREPQLAQMAFYRNPVSPEEIAAGGYLQLRPDTYERRGSGGMSWIEHRNFWTTNPSLFGAEITKRLAWPVEERCEGLFGFDLRALVPDVTFGLWGNGDPWVRHFGERSGHGY